MADSDFDVDWFLIVTALSSAATSGLAHGPTSRHGGQLCESDAPSRARRFDTQAPGNHTAAAQGKRPKANEGLHMTGQKKILLGYNLYFTSNEVTEVAIEHCRAFDAKLLVVSSVVGHSLDKKTGQVGNVEARERLEKLKAILEKEGISYEVHLLVRRANPGSDLVRFAEENDVFEMVIGFKERSTIGEIVFGSNYRLMIGKAPCPVVTVHVKDNGD